MPRAPGGSAGRTPISSGGPGQRGLDQPPDPLPPDRRSLADERGRRHAAVEGGLHRRGDLVGRDAGCRDVGDRAPGRRDPHAAPGDGVAGSHGVGGRVDDDAVLLRQATAVPGHGEVHSVGKGVGEVEHLQGGLVGHDRVGCEAKPCRDDLVARLGRVVPEPVEASANSDEPAGPHVVAEQAGADRTGSAGRPAVVDPVSPSLRLR